MASRERQKKSKWKKEVGLNDKNDIQELTSYTLLINHNNKTHESAAQTKVPSTDLKNHLVHKHNQQLHIKQLAF